MNTPPSQENKAGKKSSILVLGFVTACFFFLIGTLLLMFEAPSPTPPPKTPTPIPSPLPSPLPSPIPTRPHINIPTIEYPTIPPSAPSYILPIHSIGDSGISGNVTFEDVAGEVAILLHLDGLPDEEILPVELRHGSCDAPGELAYQVVSPDAGESETDLSINLEEFNTQRPFAILVYRSAEDRTALACGDIP